MFFEYIIIFNTDVMISRKRSPNFNKSLTPLCGVSFAILVLDDQLILSVADKSISAFRTG